MIGKPVQNTNKRLIILIRMRKNIIFIFVNNNSYVKDFFMEYPMTTIPVDVFQYTYITNYSIFIYLL